MYATALQREEKICYLWLNAMFFTESDCVDLAIQISQFLSFLYLPGSFQPDYLDGIVAQISNDKSPNENSDFKAPGAVGWRFALRDYSHTVPGFITTWEQPRIFWPDFGVEIAKYGNIRKIHQPLKILI